MEIAKIKVKFQTLLVVNPIITLERLLKKICKKGDYMKIKCHNNPGDNDSGSYKSNFPFCGRAAPKEWLAWKDKLLKALDGQSICSGPQRYMFTERLLTGGGKATFNQVALDIGIYSVDNFN